MRASAFLLGGWAMALTVGMDVGLAASPQQREGRSGRPSAPERTLDRMTEDAPVAKPKFAGSPAEGAKSKPAPRGASSHDALKLLKEARIALSVGEPEAAVRLADKAEQADADFTNSVDSPKKVKALIAQFERISKQTGSKSDLALADAKFYMTQADGLLLHRDFASAERLCRDAAKIKAKFTANERTPEMLLKYISEERRAVVATSGTSKKYDVQNGLYSPEQDTTRNVKASAQEPQEAAPPSTPAGDESGLELYEQGIEALEKGDRQAALDLFTKAFAHRKDLEPGVQQDLGDKLVGLRRSLGANAADKSQLEDISSKEGLAAQKMIDEWANERAAAEKLVNTDPNAAIAKLESFRDKVGQAEVNNAVRQRLLAGVDRELASMRTFIESNKPEIELNAKNKEVLAAVDDRRERSVEVENKLAQLVDDFNMLIDERRYAEAEVVAKQANELAPTNPTVQVMVFKAQFVSRQERDLANRRNKENGYVEEMINIDGKMTPFGDDSNPLKMGTAKEWLDLTGRRGRSDGEARLSSEERVIYQALQQRVEVKFTDKSLSEVLDLLSQTTGVNIVPDMAGFVEEGIQTSEPVTLNLRQPVSMRSALRLMLDPLGLDFTVKNESLVITSKRLTQNSLTTVAYDVADLVIPIPNFIPNANLSLQDAIRNGIHTLGYGGVWRPLGSGPVTVSPADAMAQNQPGNEGNSALDGVQGAFLAQNGMSGSLPSQQLSRPTKFNGYEQFNQGGGAMADFQSLISLITLTIDPDSWLANGDGTGEIQPFYTNLTLVISQTQEVHEKIADLLKQLRRLQDLQITIEVRFISLSDNFFERIGIDFDVSLEDGQVGTGFNTNQDKFRPGRVVGTQPGATGGTSFTPNLDIDFRQGSFGSAVPAFGGFDPATAANFGFAILSDIEVYFLLQAAQGDTRTNVLQAPKVTLFNGQSASVVDVLNRPFVTGIIPVVGDFAAAHQPVVVVLSEGTSMHVQAVVNSDRKYVRMTLVPTFTRIGDVETFTFNGRTSTSGGTVKVDPTDPNSTVTDGGTTTTEGTTVQLPQQAQTSVNTTVSVPDGGTILLGGVKRSREARNERGVPLLSKIPYVNRLFRNVAIGRETSSLMMMVTPRIIIQEEEITKLTGSGATP